MSQPQESVPFNRDAQRPLTGETDVPTLQLPGMASDLTVQPTHRLAEIAVADDQPDTAILPAIELLPTLRRAAVKIAPDEPPTTMPREATKAKTPRTRRRIFSTLVALGVFLVANLVVQLNRPFFDAQSDGYFGLQRVQACESLGRVPDIIYLGSSRAVYGVSPNVIDTLVRQQTGKTTLGCNVATFGSTIDHDYYILKRLIDDGYAPKMVVENAWEYPLNLRASYQGSNGYSQADEESTTVDESAWIANVSDLPDLYQKFKAVPLGLSKTKLFNFLAERLIPLYGDRFGILRLLCHGSTIGPCGATLPGVDALSASRYESADRQGYVSLTGYSIANYSPSQIYHAEHGEFDYGPTLQNFTVGGHQINYLRMLLSMAQAHHIQVVLVTSPLNPIYFYYLHPVTDWQKKIVPFWNSIAAQYNIQYYDESHAKGYTNADWRDPEHLDSTGAFKFSTWIAMKIVIPDLSKL
jgi:hypothetical protein